jgi:hypothetical protein
VVERYLPGIAQFVILGAGFDTRALNLPKNAPVRSFEVDTPATQAAKRELLAKAEIDSTRVALVSANFETEDWLTKLIDAGFDPTQSALFVWEGVTMYLDREAVNDTLHKIAGTAKGSAVAFDYFTSDVLESQTLFMRTVRAWLNASGEPLKFGVDSAPPSRERLAELSALAECHSPSSTRSVGGLRKSAHGVVAPLRLWSRVVSCGHGALDGAVPPLALCDAPLYGWAARGEHSLVGVHTLLSELPGLQEEKGFVAFASGVPGFSARGQL